MLGDPTGQLTQAWIVAQELMLLYRRGRDLRDAQHRLWKILDHCTHAEVPELLRLARTLDAWRTELLAAFPPDRTVPGQQRPDRGGEHAHQEDRARLPQPGQLPPAAAARGRSGLAHRALAGCASHPDQRPLTTLGGVEPSRDTSPLWARAHEETGSAKGDAQAAREPSPRGR